MTGNYVLYKGVYDKGLGFVCIQEYMERNYVQCTFSIEQYVLGVCIRGRKERFFNLGFRP